MGVEFQGSDGFEFGHEDFAFEMLAGGAFVVGGQAWLAGVDTVADQGQSIAGGGEEGWVAAKIDVAVPVRRAAADIDTDHSVAGFVSGGGGRVAAQGLEFASQAAQVGRQAFDHVDGSAQHDKAFAGGGAVADGDGAAFVGDLLAGQGGACAEGQAAGQNQSKAHGNPFDENAASIIAKLRRCGNSAG